MDQATSGIDEDKLNELKEILEEGFADVLGEFFAYSKTELVRLQDAIHNESTDDIFMISHSLKSSSGNFGFLRMFELCRELELQARQNRVEDANGQYGMIKDELDRLGAYFNY